MSGPVHDPRKPNAALKQTVFVTLELAGCAAVIRVERAIEPVT